MVARLVPSKRAHLDDSQSVSPPRPSPASQLAQARASFLRALLDYFESHQSIRYPTELTIPVPPYWSSLPSFESDVRELLVSAAEGLPSINQFLLRHLTKEHVTVFPRSQVRNLGCYLIASDLAYDLREFLAQEKGAKTLATGFRKEIRDGESGSCYTPGWAMWNAEDSSDVMIVLECPRGINRTPAESRLKAMVQTGAARIGILAEVEVGLTATKGPDGTTTHGVTSSAMILRIFALSTKKTISEFYSSSVVEYDPLTPPTEYQTPPDIVLPLAPFLQDSVDRGRKGLMLSVGGESIMPWVREVYVEAETEWKRGNV